jgi:DNA polymerase-3 subunit beta
MPYTIEKNALYEILQKTYPFVPAKSSLQILSNIKISLHTDILEVSATDLDHSIKAQCQIQGDGDVEIAVNAKKIFEVVRELSNGPVVLSVDENILSIKSSDSFQCKISGTDTRDYPAFPEIENSDKIFFSSSELCEMINKSSFAVSKDETRACLCGVLWEIDKKKSGMVSTDGHRLGSCFYTGTFSVNSKLKNIISPKTLSQLVRIIQSSQNNTEISVILGEKYVLFSMNGVSLCSKLIEGPYPDYEKVIPKNNPKKSVIEKNILIDAVRRVSVFSNQKTHLVKFIFRKNELEIIVLNKDIGGEARQIIPVEYDGDEHIIGFNAQYFTEILNIISTNKIRIEMSTQISACLLFPEDRKDDICDDLFLIMPLRIMEEV